MIQIDCRSARDDQVSRSSYSSLDGALAYLAHDAMPSTSPLQRPLHHFEDEIEKVERHISKRSGTRSTFDQLSNAAESRCATYDSQVRLTAHRDVSDCTLI